ncbi:hypothetical protein VKT23_019287 [Stygiomarasmius scandens]|uniref:DUF6534 domain-containing protein n=1 Tax=Marasmiellus scandens TaxID=2682957 RepID=A0ABR1IM12_9AGAR
MAPIPGIGATTGPQLFGFLFNYGLLGALVVQTYHYHLEYPEDRKLLKTIVYTLLFLEVVQSILMSYDAYKIFGEGYGDWEALDINHTDWFTVCILGSIVAGIVQFFYAHRLWLFSKSIIAGGIVSILALTQIIAGIAQGIFGKIVGNFSELQKRSPIALGIWIGSSALCDIIIAVTMVYYLKKCHSAFSNTNAMIKKLVQYSVETGLVTAIIATVLIILFLASPGHDFFETPAKFLAKLYSNNLLVLLNSRTRLQNKNGTANYVSEILNEFQLDTAIQSGGNVNSQTEDTSYHIALRPNTIHVHKETETWKEPL